MPAFNDLKTNFVSGEIDALLRGRSDIKHYFNAAELARNVVVLPQGGLAQRPGSTFVWKVPRNVDDGTVSNIRLCSFQFSTEQTYLFVFHHKRVAIFRDGVFQATVTTPWTSNDLVAHIGAKGEMIDSGINWTQSKDTLVVFHENYAPREIKRAGSHILWTIGNYVLKNIPRVAFPGTTYVNGVDEQQGMIFPNPGTQGDWTNLDTFKLILEDEETDNIVYDSVGATMAARIQTALRELPQVEAAGITVTTAGGPGTPLTSFFVSFTLGNGQRPWGAMGYRVMAAQQVPTIEINTSIKGVFPGEDAWSVSRGYPRCGVFFQGRFFMAGSKSLPNSFWFSRAGDITDFNNKKIADDYGFAGTADTDDVPAFLNIYVGRHIQFFSTAGEFYIPKSEDEGVTPGNAVLRRTTSRGSKPGLKVFEVDGATIFVQRRGKALREFIFADVELAYQANNISLLASHLMRDPVGYTLRKSSSTDDADFLYLANTDGTMTVFCTLRTQEVNGFTLWNTQGSYLDVTSLLDDVYQAVNRTIDGVPDVYIELQDDTILYDCAVKGTVGVSTPSITVAHLPDTVVGVNLEGFLQQDILSNGSGLVTFTRPAVGDYVIGLPWPDAHPDYPGLKWIAKTLPIERQVPQGAMMGKKRRIVNAALRLHETNGLIVNGNRVSFQQFGSDLLDTPPPSFTGVKTIRGMLGWDYDGSLVLGDNIATRATILGLGYGVSF